MMLGYLLAREGVPVVVLEKHADFFRDFRGDTVHPSTLELFHELGLLEEFLKLPHQELKSVGGVFGGYRFELANVRYVRAHSKFVALMPQWDFLNFLTEKARKFPSFELRMEHEAVGLTRDGDRITGVEVRTASGDSLHVKADLVVGCDGRSSTVRAAAQPEVLEVGVPIDVLWFRISRKGSDPEQLLGNINYGRVLVLVNRTEYFQAGLIIPKGSFERMKEDGLDAFREIVRKIAPHLADRVEEIQDWDQVKLLTVQINRLRRWYRAGLLCIGDAAHAMSPAGGVGINLAIQDAVAAANLLTRSLQRGHVTEGVLQRVQERREFPTRVTQFLQKNAHRGFAAIFRARGPMEAPWQLKFATQIPGLKYLLGHVVGMGVRPEHVLRPAPNRRSKQRSFLDGVIGIAVVVAIGVDEFRRRTARA
jgi:2-polyprenyl-6-methoxyphenol hydroxylase-like FAD-dependent oxidoreductase